MKIQVGCGDSPIPGWRNFDNSISLRLARVPLLSPILRRAGLLNPRQFAFVEFTRVHRIEYGDGVKGLPIPDSSVEALYSCHMIEHLSRTGAGRFLEEARRVLIPGGVIRLAVPDLRRLANRYLATGDADKFIATTYLGQEDDESFAGRLSTLIAGPRLHGWMYDETSMVRLLRDQCFSEVAAVPPGETRIREPGELDLREKEDESIYVEALKPAKKPGGGLIFNRPAAPGGPAQ